MFFKEEIAEFQHFYFENICALLDNRRGMDCFCRDVFLRTKGIVPDLDKDALGIIALDLEFRYMFDTKHKINRWGYMQIPRDLIGKYAGRILAKVVVRRGGHTSEGDGGGGTGGGEGGRASEGGGGGGAGESGGGGASSVGECGKCTNGRGGASAG